MNKKTYTSIIFALFAAIFGGLVSAYSQDESKLTLVRIVKVKPDRIDDFHDLMRQYRDARVEAGLSGQWVWEENRGHLNMYHIVTEADNFAALDAPMESGMEKDKWMRWVHRIMETVDSAHYIIARGDPDLNIERSNEEEAPKFLILRTDTVAIGKNDAYRSWLAEKLVPALRESGTSGFFANEHLYGMNPNTWVRGRLFDTWAELDEGEPLSKLGAEEREAIFADYPELVVSSDVRILRFVGWLSHSEPEEVKE